MHRTLRMLIRDVLGPYLLLQNQLAKDSLANGIAAHNTVAQLKAQRSRVWIIYDDDKNGGPLEGGFYIPSTLPSTSNPTADNLESWLLMAGTRSNNNAGGWEVFDLVLSWGHWYKLRAYDGRWVELVDGCLTTIPSSLLV